LLSAHGSSPRKLIDVLQLWDGVAEVNFLSYSLSVRVSGKRTIQIVSLKLCLFFNLTTLARYGEVGLITPTIGCNADAMQH